MDVLDEIELSPPKVIKVNGQKMELSEQAEKKLRDTYCRAMQDDLEEKKKAVKSYLAQIKTEYEEKENQFKDTLAQSFPFPDYKTVADGKIVYGARNGMIRFDLPFKYAPISVNKNKIVHPEELERDVRMVIDIAGTTKKYVYSFDLLNSDGTKFEHYHRMIGGANCTGSTFGVHDPVSSFQDILAFRHKVEMLYSDIHHEGFMDTSDHRVRQRSEGLPAVSQIQTTTELAVWHPESVQQPALQGVGANVWHVDPATPVIQRVERHHHWWDDLDVESVLQMVIMLAMMAGMIYIIVTGISPDIKDRSTSTPITQSDTSNPALNITTSLTPVK
jgi:hypothetical protein